MKQKLKYLKIGGLIAVPIVLLLLPSTFFDNGPPMCLSVVLFDTNCYGCGMTRGIMHLLHGDWQTAREFNKLSIIVFPLLGILWLEMFFKVLDVKINIFKKQAGNNKKKV